MLSNYDDYQQSGYGDSFHALVDEVIFDNSETALKYVNGFAPDPGPPTIDVTLMNVPSFMRRKQLKYIRGRWVLDANYGNDIPVMLAVES
jgi:hypothetical protein